MLRSVSGSLRLRQLLKRFWFWRAGIAVAAVGLTFLLKLLLESSLKLESPFLLFFTAVIVSAWFGGRGSGWLATGLAAVVSDYFFLSPAHSFWSSDPGQRLRLILFVLEGGFISWVIEALHTSHRQAEIREAALAGSQEVLQQRETQLRLITDSLPVLIAAVDTQQRYTFNNKTYEDWFGQSASTVTGQHLQTVLGPTAYESVRGYVEAALAGQQVTFESEIPYQHGGIRYVSATYVPQFGPQGTVTGYVALISDISEAKRVEDERKRAEQEQQAILQALQASETRFRRLVESNIVGIILVDFQGKILEANDAFLNMLGYSRSDLEAGSINWQHMTPPEYQSQDQRVIAELRTAGVSAPFEKEYFSKDGRRVPVLIGAVVLVSTAPTCICLVLDLTQRRQLEEERNQLLAQEQAARAAAETAERRATFLAEASRVLASSLDYETTLSALTQLAVPEIADWCAVDILDESGTLQRLAVAHHDPAKVDLAWELHRRYPQRPSDALGIMHVLQTGEPEIATEITDALLAALAQDQEHLQLLQSLGLKSYLIAPLVARGRRFGTITLITAESGRSYASTELALVEDLAHRAALAVDNARLYSKAQAALARQRNVEEKLTLLVEASSTLISSLQLEALLPKILDLSCDLIAADAYAIWRFYPFTGQWQIIAAVGLSEAYQQSAIAITETTPTLPTEPLAIEEIAQEPLLAGRWEGYRREGISSLLVLPLKIQGQISGTLTFYYRHPHRFNETEVRVGTALSNLAAAAIGSTELYETQKQLRAEAESARQRLAFLAEVSTVLGASLDYEATLSQLARLAVPQVGDGCLVHILSDQGELQRLEVAHINPAKEAAMREIQHRYPLNSSADNPLLQTLQTGQPTVIAEMSDSLLQTVAQDAEHLEMLRNLQIRSAMLVPLVGRGRTLGALTFIATETERVYGAADFALAEDVAGRAAIAVDNAQLYHQAQAVNRIKDEFLATLSHELRTPLNAMLGWAQLLRTRELEATRMARALETIERNAKSLAQLIEDLLDISRIITGKLRLELRALNLITLIETTLESVRPAAEAKQIALNCQLDPAASLIMGDETRCQQIIWNLLSNAIKFTPKGGEVNVYLHQEASNAQIVVTDNGQGIAPDFLPYLFERFQQADGTTTRTHGGLGLGLAIVRHLVESHGGTIAAYSLGEGQGATFTVSLPLKADGLGEQLGGLAIAPSTPDQEPRLEPKPQVATPLKGLRILVVDDEADARDLVTVILEQRGATTVTTASAPEALQVLITSGLHDRPDVLISDIGMPGEDGYTLIQKIRRLPPAQGGRIPAIALTAYARTAERLQAIAAGFQVHLAKPVTPEELVKAVSSLV